MRRALLALLALFAAPLAYADCGTVLRGYSVSDQQLSKCLDALPQVKAAGASLSSGTPTVPFLFNSLSTGGNFNEWMLWANGTKLRTSTTCLYAGCMVDTGVGDIQYESTYTQPTLGVLMDDNTANNSADFFVAQNPSNSVVGQTNVGIMTDTSTRCGAFNAGGSTAATPDVTSHVCGGIGVASGATNQVALVGQVNKVNTGTNINVFDFEGNTSWLAIGFTTPVKWIQSTSTGTSQASVTVGDTNASSTTLITGPAGGISFGNLSTGTNADFLCLSGAGVVLLQSSACTISSRRFKTDIHPLHDDALGEIAQLPVKTFRLRGKNPDPNASSVQAGLIAEDVARIAPECAIYENDMQTPKSYRQECVIALLVKAVQEQQKEIKRLKGF